IRKEDMEKLFKPFERLDEKKNRNIQGTGLGLDIARQMIEMMGGELHCDSEYGKGSEFFFTIPQNVIKDKPIGHDWKAQVRHGEGGIDPSMPLFVAPEAKVLVVDDNDMNLAVARGLLKRSMVQVSTATGGRECIKLMSENEYDLVFLDHMMPEMDGIETLHALRDMGIQTPVIALTANAVSGMKDTYIREGFDSFLAKPIDGLKLEKTMRDFISPSKMKKPDRTDRTDETMPLQTAEGETPADVGSSDGELPEWLTELDEIDTEEGLKNNADVDMYLSMLEIFYNSIEDKSAEIRSLFEAEDWQNYTIKVHALKSSARIIGAMSLNKWAQSLEDAGHENNIDRIKSETDDFLRSYEAFKSLIAPIAPELTEAEDDREEAPETMIEDAYNSLREFASAQDYDLTEMVLNSMKEYRLPEVHEEKMKQIEKLMYELRWDDINDTLNNTL
ncbi:MAG: response regulator, partial [Eubacterium sp.]|nr:response regulator [Eubacterium sp.]